MEKLRVQMQLLQKYKHGGINLTKRLVQLFTIIWDSRSVPQDFKNASPVHIYTRKGDTAICDNHHGISLICIADKILARIMLNRLTHHIADNVLLESQCGFRAGRGTTDMIFAMRQIQEKCHEQNQDLYMVFIELTRAFDSANRTGLSKLLAKVGCPDSFVDDGMMARVQDQGTESDVFTVSNGTKQGCVVAPMLFSIIFSIMLQDAFLRKRSRRLHSISHQRKHIQSTVPESQDQDYRTTCPIKRIIASFAKAPCRFGLTISLK